LNVSSDQMTFYDDGIGADAAGLERVFQGALGQGLFDKIQNGFTKIAHVYESGDEVYLFGFSRGAYTARSLAGMIANCGLPTGSFTDDCVKQAFAAYRDPANRSRMLAELGGCNLGKATIRMIGVWDTVGSLGIPALFGAIDQKTYGFLDTSLHPEVKSAYHCLAIDEKRAQFPATLWTSPPAPGQTIEQVWFSGCHSDVGGGTTAVGGVDAATQLCDITLSWMAAKAQAQGLTFDPAATAQFAILPSKYALDAIHESWSPKDGPPHLRTIDAKSSIASSVAVRLQYGQTYAPGNLTLDNGALADSYLQVSVVNDAGF
jgi:uncharacterized protein (DUF2235 family)